MIDAPQVTLEEHIMSNRNRMATAGVLNARAAALNNPGLGIMRPNPALYAQQVRPPMVVPPPLMAGPPSALLEQKITTQHNEIQRLLTENQRLAATHVALRQELAAAQQEVQRMQAMLQGIQSEKEVQIRYTRKYRWSKSAEALSLWLFWPCPSWRFFPIFVVSPFWWLTLL